MASILPSVAGSIRIDVTDTPIDEKHGISSKTQKAYHMRTQTAYAYVVSHEGVLCDFPEKFEISLEDGQSPYVRGSYTLHPSVFVIKADSFGHPKLVADDRPRLVAVPAASSAPASR